MHYYPPKRTGAERAGRGCVKIAPGNVVATILIMLPADGLVVFSKRACPTCYMIEPVMQHAARAVPGFRIVSQDDPSFPREVSNILDDRELDQSWLNNIEATPTLVRFSQGSEAERVVGWDRDGWRRLTGIRDLGEGLPAFQPG